MAARTMFKPQEAGIRGFLARRAREGLGVGLGVIALLIAATLLGHNPYDPSINNAAPGPVANPLGYFGASLSDFLLQTFGRAAWIPVLILPLWGLRLIVDRPLAWAWLPLVALPVAMLASCAWLATLPIPGSWPYWVGLGGSVGDLMMHRLERPVGPESYPLIMAISAIVALILAVGVSWREGWQMTRGVAGLALRRREAAPKARRRPTPPRRAPAVDQRPDEPASATDRRRPFALPRVPWLARVGNGLKGLFRRGGKEPAPATPVFSAEETIFAQRRRAGGAPRVSEPHPEPRLGPSRAAADDGPQEPGELVPETRFQLPPLKFLAQPRSRSGAPLDRTMLTETARALEKVLDDFGVRGEIVDIRPGPVVTLYELEPAPGTRAARVISLADDIARSLCAMSVRVATVPGRNVIGIELPNDQRETVYLRDLLASPVYEDTAARLTLALGKDIGGDPVVVDLSRMPHLLIAGTTGSGKSVAINAMILSLLYRLPPEECKLIMIDPKVIELSVYEGIPHLLSPVVTEPHKAIVALKWVVREMDERYRLMSHLGVRDLFAYNRRIGEAMTRGEQLSRRVQTGFEPGTGVPVFEQQPIEMERMPLVVVIVDEVADLMLTAGKEIESAIQRLSQKARAAGIHLIVATQRPSVDVLTGVIKANLPSRISFRVSSKIDSRTILGEPGAEQLLGQGDLLFMMPGERIVRIHGPLVTDEEVERVVGYLREQGEPDYIDSITDESALDGDGPVLGLGLETNGNEDAQYAQALQIIASEGKASTSFLQRKLRIGYNSAARLIERMETEGHVSRPDHVGRRQVLIGQDAEPGDAPW